jgi:outer membrane protein, heavy metal efflux system
MKYIITVLLLAILPIGSALSQTSRAPSAPTNREDFQAMIEEAISRNPEIAAESYKMVMAERRIPQAGSLDDPELTFKVMEIPGLSFSQAMYANVELMQMIPFPSKLAARKSIAELLSLHSHHQYMEKASMVITDLKMALSSLWFSRESLKINKSNEAYLRQIHKAAETSYVTGQISQQEILKTNIELSRISVNEAKIREQIVTAESKVRAILNRSFSTPIGMFNLEPAPDSLPTIEELVSFANENRPMLIHDSLNVVEKEMTVGLMKKDYMPDFKLALEYVRMPTLMENRWSISAGISLPFAPWTIARTSSRVEEAEADQMMLASMYTASKNMVQSQIYSEYASLQSIRKEIQSLQNSIIPQVNQSLQLLLTEYQAGRTSYLMVLDGYRMFNETQLDFAMAQMNYQQTLAALEREVGVSDIRIVAAYEKENQQ